MTHAAPVVQSTLLQPGSNNARVVQVAGVGANGAPANATAVVMNVTAVALDPGYLTVYPNPASAADPVPDGVEPQLHGGRDHPQPRRRWRRHQPERQGPLQRQDALPVRRGRLVRERPARQPCARHPPRGDQPVPGARYPDECNPRSPRMVPRTVKVTGQHRRLFGRRPSRHGREGCRPQRHGGCTRPPPASSPSGPKATSRARRTSTTPPARSSPTWS